MAESGKECKSEFTAESHPELLALFNNVNQDIDRTKKQQWTVFYAILIANTGLLGFYSLRPKTSWADWFIGLFVFLLVLGLAHLKWSQWNLNRFRDLATFYTKHFTHPTRALLLDDSAADPPRWVEPVAMGIVLAVAATFSIIVACNVGGGS